MKFLQTKPKTNWLNVIEYIIDIGAITFGFCAFVIIVYLMQIILGNKLDPIGVNGLTILIYLTMIWFIKTFFRRMQKEFSK